MNLDHLLCILAQTTPPTPDAAEESTSLWGYIREGGLISYVMIGLSVTAVALMVRNALMLRERRQSPPEVAARVEMLLRENNLKEVEKVCSHPDNDSFLTRVVASALARCANSPFGMLEFRTGIEEGAIAEVDRLHRSNDGIGIIAAVGPMLGLLGTVIGMIGAFRTIGTLTGSARSTQLATFMSMALVNTAEGLVVAIPCTIAFALFRRKIDALAANIGVTLERYTGIVQAGNAMKTAGAIGAPPPAARPAAVGR